MAVDFRTGFRQRFGRGVKHLNVYVAPLQLVGLGWECLEIGLAQVIDRYSERSWQPHEGGFEIRYVSKDHCLFL